MKMYFKETKNETASGYGNDISGSMKEGEPL
jgi:hypothetical protein